MRWIKEGRELNDGETREVRRFLFSPYTDHEWTRFSVGNQHKPDTREWRKTTRWLEWVTIIQKYDRHSATWKDWRVKEEQEDA